MYYNYQPAPWKGNLGRGEISSDTISNGEMELYRALKRNRGSMIKEPKSYFFPDYLRGTDIVVYLEKNYGLSGVDVVMDVCKISDYREATKEFNDINSKFSELLISLEQTIIRNE